MATLDEFIATQGTANAAIDAALTGITGDINLLNERIADLLAAGGALGTLTPAQQSAVDALVLSGETLNAKAQALDDLTPQPKAA